MPKVKTNSGAKKRFTFTATGKIKRRHAYHSHILTKKTKKQKRNLSAIMRKLQPMIPHFPPAYSVLWHPAWA